uniref:Cryptochrome/DNA photolyase FAD-binding domain-containing protein n=1 Tax=Alexandrium monilatum TaxID=311494 RepID=A0A7S4Q6T9_9DINO
MSAVWAATCSTNRRRSALAMGSRAATGAPSCPSTRPVWPERLSAPAFAVRSEPIDRLGLDSGVSPGGEDWGASIRKAWGDISETAALRQLESYVQRKDGLHLYEKQRSRADLERNPNSKLSAYVRWGQISPHDIFWSVQDAGLPREETKTFGRRLFWRDLAYFQLHHFPEMRRRAIRAHYDAARWCTDKALLRLWQRGRTGYPLVDAAMRELRATGWVQQNVRMVAASFLTEFLNISWTEGAKWYEDELVDADHAINSMMWQNAGRSGIDQWNFLISPVEAKAQDPTGAYVRRWVPELAGLPSKYLHAPWDCPPNVLANCGVRLGESYPNRCILDLRAAREEAKRATLEMRRGIAGTWMNDHNGYDVIALPDGTTTKVFTKREYRLARDGRPMDPSAPAGRKGGGKGRAATGAQPWDSSAPAGGRGGGKGRAAAAAGRAAKVPRVDASGPQRQTSLAEYAAGAALPEPPPNARQRRWVRLRDDDD